MLGQDGAVQDPFTSVVGQERAVEHLRAAAGRPVHAYLFIGPAGSGKRVAANAFAAALLQDERALHGVHPDVVTVEREGASINVAQAREIARLAARSPIEGQRKVLVLTEFHLVDEAAPALLKTIEEASPSTIFVILADSLTKELTTIASRCVKVEFAALPAELIERTLLAEGFPAERSALAAESAFGNLERARLLAADDAVAARHELWVNIPSRLDGTGATVARIADEIAAALDHASEPLVARQVVEQTEIKAKSKEMKLGAGAAKDLETRHKREQRRLRADELRAGFATLAQEVRRRFVDAVDARAATRLEGALAAVTTANESLLFNPAELLLLQRMLVDISLSLDGSN